jgi:membrane protein DedA with SNARE-associated domain
MEAFIDKFGYFAIVVGTFLEGEAILLFGGIFAVMGYLHPIGVIIAAFLGALAGDVASYLLGALKPRRFLRAIGIVRRHEARARKFFQKHGPASMLFGHFFYGMRIAGGFVCGLVGMPMRKFLLWAAIGCSIWAVLVGSAGYLLGQGAIVLLGDVRRYQSWIFFGMIGMVLAGLTLFIWRTRRRQRRVLTVLQRVSKRAEQLGEELLKR